MFNDNQGYNSRMNNSLRIAESVQQTKWVMVHGGVSAFNINEVTLDP